MTIALLLAALLSASPAAAYQGATPAGSSAAREALQALRALQSAAGGGVTYQDYGLRLTETKAKVYRYLASPEQGDLEARAAMEKALRFYLLASAAWSTRLNVGEPAFNGEWTWIGHSPLLDECQGTRPIAQALRNRSSDLGRTVANTGIPALWSCAGEKVTEAAKLLGEAE